MSSETSKPDFTSVQSIEPADPSNPRIPPNPAEREELGHVRSSPSSTIDEHQNYIVAEGDTWRTLAERFYGNAGVWKAIFEANRDQLMDPEQLRPGQILKIPPVQEIGAVR